MTMLLLQSQSTSVLSISQAADEAGLSYWTVFRWIKNPRSWGQLPAEKIGKGYRIKREDWNNYLAERGRWQQKTNR